MNHSTPDTARSTHPASDVAQMDGRARTVIEGVSPEIDGGRFPIKRTIGEPVVVQADVFADGHDLPACVVRYRHRSEADWSEVPMARRTNDRWWAEWTPQQLGRYEYTVMAWVDRFHTWRHDLAKRLAADQDVQVDLQIGAQLVQEAAQQATGEAQLGLAAWTQRLQDPPASWDPRSLLDDLQLEAWMDRYLPRRYATTYEPTLQVVVDRTRARFSSWYELFPRSASPEPGRHGTLRDVQDRLAYIAEMGFDVLYLPPIHPIGQTHRKGPNNAPTAGPNDVGSPWAIGGPEGGHKAIHPALGTLEDFRALVAKAQEYGLEIALDIAFQCAPDHPYAQAHPEWFRRRPDGTIQYAENPPKKYEDIYPFDFESPAWPALWEELASVFTFWLEQGVHIFRVDNPHTKPFAFWEWVIERVKADHPEVIFLSEAFTRPKIMYRLAKLGFTQSYTYFAWRNTKHELQTYLTELTRSRVREFFRPNFWPNTPDILTEYLQLGGRAAFQARLILAATLSASYGIYGPPFELMENTPRCPGSEEYLDSEKYQLRHWQLDRPDSLRHLIARVNQIRRQHPALQANGILEFHRVDNDELICYSKHAGQGEDLILVVVNLDPHHRQSGWVELPLEPLGIDPDHPFQVHDLLTDARYLWHGSHNYVELDPEVMPAHIFRIRRRIRTERDFEYYL